MTKESASRVRELDGVRGLAILLVMCLHIFAKAVHFIKNPLIAFLTKVSGVGWVGVDIFFVLSGFLITSILLNTRQQPGYFKNFYARRILRIFPLYYLTIAAILLSLPILTPKTAASNQASWPYFVLYLQNWLVIPALNLGTNSLYLGSSWSLAVEEQFYLIWPALVFLLSRSRLAFLSVAILIFSLAGRLLLLQFGGPIFSSPQFFYFSSVTRFDGFAVGALIAIAFQSAYWKQVFARFAWPVLLISLAGIVFIAMKSVNFFPLSGNDALNTWGYSLIALATGALMVVLTTSPQQMILSRFFRGRLLAFFGKYSYAMYLIHYPIVLILYDLMDHTHRNSLEGWLIFVGSSFGLTILGSLLSWYLLEKPVLALKKYFEYKPIESAAKE